MSCGTNLPTLWRNWSSLLLQYVGKFLPGYTALCPLVSNSEYSLTTVSHCMLQVNMMMAEQSPLILEAMSTLHTHLAETRVTMCFRMMSSESQLMVGQRWGAEWEVRVANWMISLFGQLPELTLPLFAALLDWGQLPACQILMISIWNHLFDLVLDIVSVYSKVSERKPWPEPRWRNAACIKKKIYISKVNMGHWLIDNNCTS